MPRPRNEVPEVKRRLRANGNWQLTWWADGRWHSLSAATKDEREAEARRLEVALALRRGNWPEWATSAPAVQRFLNGDAAPPKDAGALLESYERSLRAAVTASWAGVSVAYLRELQDGAGKPLAAVTPRDAQAFLDGMIRPPGQEARPRSRATRNRALAACSRFYRWAVRTGAVRQNPFAGLSALLEAQPAEIVYLSRPERDAILEAALALPDGAAVWLALLAGLRRGEIMRTTWADLLEHGKLRVGVSKTGKRRIVPLPAKLTARLAELKPDGATGRIVPWPADVEEAKWRARLLIEALQAACPKVPAERIRWNAFRHTFGSLLAQAGVSLDKVSSWMGNSPAVCRRHYAEFTLRDEHDEDIELL